MAGCMKKRRRPSTCCSEHGHHAHALRQGTPGTCASSTCTNRLIDKDARVSTGGELIDLGRIQPAGVCGRRRTTTSRRGGRPSADELTRAGSEAFRQPSSSGPPRHRQSARRSAEMVLGRPWPFTDTAEGWHGASHQTELGTDWMAVEAPGGDLSRRPPVASKAFTWLWRCPRHLRARSVDSVGLRRPCQAAR